MDQRSIDELVSGVMTGAVNRRQLLTRAAILGISGPTLVALLAACGSDDDEDGNATAASGSSGGAESTAETDGEATEATGAATEADGGEGSGRRSRKSRRYSRSMRELSSVPSSLRQISLFIFHLPHGSPAISTCCGAKVVPFLVLL